MDFKKMSRDQLIDEIMKLKGKAGATVKPHQNDLLSEAEYKLDLANKLDLLTESLKLGRTGIWYNDLANGRLYWSGEVFRIFNTDPAEFRVTFEAFLELVYPEDRKKVKDAHLRSITSNLDTYIIEHRIVRKVTNEVLHVMERCVHTHSQDGKITGSLGTIQDISELRDTESDLKEKNRRMDVLLNNLNGVVYRCKNDRDWSMEFISKGVFDLTGYPAEDFISCKHISFNDIIAEEDRLMVWDEIQKAVELHSHFTIEYRIKTRSGQIKWVWEKGRAVFDKNNLVALEGFISDITDRKITEAKLQESELHFRQLADSGEALIWTSGTDKLCNYFNKIWLDFTGRSIEQELGEGWAEGVHPDDLAACLEIYVNAFDKREKFRMDYRLKYHDGTYHWIQDEGVPRYDTGGNFIGYMGHCIDINQRILQHELLQKKERDYRLLFEENPNAMLISDRNTLKILEVNAAALAMYGYTREEFVSLTLEDIRPVEDIGLLHKIHKESPSQLGKILEVRHKRKNGEAFWAEVSYYEIEYKGQNARHITVIDITVSKERELKLRESEDNYRLMFETMTQGVVYQSADGRIISANKAAEKILGLSIDQMMDVTSVDLRWGAVKEDGSDFPIELHPAMVALHTGKQVRDVIMGVRNRRNGAATWINVCAVPQFRHGEKIPYQVYATLEDITDRKTRNDEIKRLNVKLEEKVRQRTAELENFFSVTLDLLCIEDIDGHFIKVNKAWEKILGHTAGELENKIFLDFVHPDDLPKTYDVLKQLGENKPVISFTNRYRSNDGSYRFIEWHSVPVGKLIYSAARDVTERIEAEENLRKARLEAEEANSAKSQFLANMSHEIRTPMNAILGYSELLESLVRDPVQKDFLNSIRTSGKTLLTLINDILDISKIEAGKLDLTPEVINTSVFFSEFRKIFAFRIKEKGLNFNINISPKVPQYIYIDGTRLRQIIMNLLGNSVKFTETGEISLNVSAEMNKVQNDTVTLLIEVADTGIGIKDEYQKKIFDSFFQVKNKYSQSGTGLGLAITTRLISMMNGTINLVSKPGEGSRFNINLPCKPLPENADTTKSQLVFDPARVRFGKSTILIVDDVHDNRRFIKDALRNSEIEIIEAYDGVNALEYQNLRELNLIITDIKMPNMDGYQLHDVLKTDRELKNIPVLAYSASVMKADQEELRNIFDGLLIKPLVVADLFREIMRFLPYVIEEDPINQTVSESSYNKSDVIGFDGLIMLLTGDIETEWRTYEKRQPMGKVRNFGVTLVKIGKEHNCIPLEMYGEELITAADSFNIEMILTLLRRYPELVEELKNG